MWLASKDSVFVSFILFICHTCFYWWSDFQPLINWRCCLSSCNYTCPAHVAYSAPQCQQPNFLPAMPVAYAPMTIYAQAQNLQATCLSGENDKTTGHSSETKTLMESNLLLNITDIRFQLQMLNSDSWDREVLLYVITSWLARHIGLASHRPIAAPHHLLVPSVLCLAYHRLCIPLSKVTSPKGLLLGYAVWLFFISSTANVVKVTGTVIIASLKLRTSMDATSTQAHGLEASSLHYILKKAVHVHATTKLLSLMAGVFESILQLSTQTLSISHSRQPNIDWYKKPIQPNPNVKLLAAGMDSQLHQAKLHEAMD